MPLPLQVAAAPRDGMRPGSLAAAAPAASAPPAVQQGQLAAARPSRPQPQAAANPFLAHLLMQQAAAGGAPKAATWPQPLPGGTPSARTAATAVAAASSGLAPKPPASALLEQMARRVMLSGESDQTVWAPPPAVRGHPEAQALASVYPELAAQISHLSRQLQLVQAQLAQVVPAPAGTHSAATTAAAATQSAPLGWQQAGQEAAGASRGRSTAAPHPQQSQPGSSFTAEDLMKAFAAGMQQQGSQPPQQQQQAAQAQPSPPPPQQQQQPSQQQPQLPGPGPRQEQQQATSGAALQELFARLGGALALGPPPSSQQAPAAQHMPPAAFMQPGDGAGRLLGAWGSPAPLALPSALQQLSAALLAAAGRPANPATPPQQLALQPPPWPVSQQATPSLQELAALLAAESRQQ